VHPKAQTSEESVGAGCSQRSSEAIQRIISCTFMKSGLYPDDPSTPTTAENLKPLRTPSPSPLTNILACKGQSKFNTGHSSYVTHSLYITMRDGRTLIMEVAETFNYTFDLHHNQINHSWIATKHIPNEVALQWADFQDTLLRRRADTTPSPWLDDGQDKAIDQDIRQCCDG
jgi:hypothetical protein